MLGLAQRRGGARRSAAARVGLADDPQLALEGEVPVLARPLGDVLELADQLLGRDEVVLGEDDDRLGLDPPGIGPPGAFFLPWARSGVRSSNISEVTRAMPPNAWTPVT